MISQKTSKPDYSGKFKACNIVFFEQVFSVNNKKQNRREHREPQRKAICTFYLGELGALGGLNVMAAARGRAKRSFDPKVTCNIFSHFQYTRFGQETGSIKPI